MNSAPRNMILAHHRGLLTCCRIIERAGDRVRVQVLDEKRPKWIDLSIGDHALFENGGDAVDWVEACNKESQ